MVAKYLDLLMGLGHPNMVLRLICGKGLHSRTGRATLRPAVCAQLRDAGLWWEYEGDNDGVLLVRLPAVAARRVGV